MFKIRYFVVFTVAALAATVVGAGAQQRSRSGALPPAVTAAFAKAYPNAAIDRWAAEVRDGQPVFEIESHEGKQKRDLLYATDGQMIEYEEAVTIAELPAAVRQAVSKAYPRATLQKAERVVRGDVTEYEVLIKGATVKEVVLSAGGAILKAL